MSSSQPAKTTGSTTAGSSAAGPDVQENLRRLDRLANLGLFSAGIAHEIKNGLVAIKTYIEVRLETDGDAEMATLVRSELARIDALATQMLRLSAPKSSIRAPVAIHPMLDQTLRLLAHQMDSRMIALERDYAATPDTISGDESQLQQAIMNLVLNGVEAIGNNGQLTVRTARAAATQGGRTLKISFHDTGPGIAPEHLAHLFEPFFTTKKNGTGLGLAITRRVAEEHHGQIEVTSTPGQGAVFSLTLPAD